MRTHRKQKTMRTNKIMKNILILILLMLATAISADQYKTIAWEHIPDARGYIVYTESNANVDTITKTSKNRITLSLLEGYKYKIQVSASFQSGEGPKSNTIKIDLSKLKQIKKVAPKIEIIE